MAYHNFQTTGHFLHIYLALVKESAITQKSANIQQINIRRQFEVIGTAGAAAFSLR